MNQPIVTVKLPKTFWIDHTGRDCSPTAVVVKELRKHVVVTLDSDAIEDLTSDADYFISDVFPEDCEQYVGMRASAIATLQALANVGITNRHIITHTKAPHIGPPTIKPR